MFNIFKGLKLHGIATLPGSTRPAGPGDIPARDWHAEYIDYLVDTQDSPTTVFGGDWPLMQWSCCHAGATNERRRSACWCCRPSR